MTMQKIEKKIDKQQVEKRIRDWKKRVAELYSIIKVWLSDTEYTLKAGPKLRMYEEQMSKFDVPATNIETADIYKNKNFILTIKPKGLWVIGANGRIDILSTKGNYMLVDFAEKFEPPKWKLFNGDKKNGAEFNKQTFFQLLE